MQITFSPPYIDEDIINEVKDTLSSGWLTTGSKVAALEKEVARYCNVEKALGVNSATSALMLVMHWFGITKGDEVIIPAYTYCATALAVMHTGATPVMADVSEDFNINPKKIKQAITKKTKAIIGVDFGGWPCDYDAFYSIVNEADVKNKFHPTNEEQRTLGRILVLADAAHSLGAVYKNKVVGSVADITVFSFHAVKNATTAEGGVICFNMPAPFVNEQIYKTLKLWSMNGQTKDAFTKSKNGGWKYDIVYPGFKINMPDVLAAIGVAQMKKYNKVIQAERIRIFKYYNICFKKCDWAITPNFKKDNCLSACHLYPLRIKSINEEQRDKIIDYIAEKNIAVNVHFIPLPMLTIFKNAGYSISDYPQSYKQYANEISLPIYPQLTNEQCRQVVEVVIKAVNFVIHHER